METCECEVRLSLNRGPQSSLFRNGNRNGDIRHGHPSLLNLPYLGMETRLRFVSLRGSGLLNLPYLGMETGDGVGWDTAEPAQSSLFRNGNQSAIRQFTVAVALNLPYLGMETNK